MTPPLTHDTVNDTGSDDSAFTLQDLIREIHAVLGPDGGLDSDHIDPNDIVRLMEKYNSNTADWNKYTHFDHSRSYTRNLVDDGNGKFNLMVLAWSKGKQSPIHDHAGSHCVMKVLDGDIREIKYEYPKNVVQDTSEYDITSMTEQPLDDANQSPLHVTKDSTYKPNQVAYIHDKIGLHRVTNPSTEHGAVSLHLYTPPYQMCKTFEEKSGRARCKSSCAFYSIAGAKCCSDTQ
ncbi:RmlC-like cupin domain-containing protein [Radiomyces spectabilis]|uniref:RmlC-like cupin domain-containing protein n=1 Tax=Radiomyces spectabilis TaxID=64574 RepID=UPI002220F095|nr:RmlC-like cupin domain-containing protein [Radiomyces spectabilis]KAI8388790.1 RmlC-like cupin domain-containing protein [Radiomyces spectabilis]